MSEQTAEHSAELYSMVRKYQPSCLVNARIGNGFGDYLSCGDNELPDKNLNILVEFPITTNRSWGYKTYDKDWKSTEEIRNLLESCNSRGGNLLLNIGSDALGRFPAPAINILKKL